MRVISLGDVCSRFIWSRHGSPPPTGRWPGDVSLELTRERWGRWDALGRESRSAMDPSVRRLTCARGYHHDSPGQRLSQRAATAPRSASGIGRWTSTGWTYRSTIERESFTPSSVNRYEIFRRWAARISPLVSRSQSCRLNGPIAFLRVVYTNCWSVWPDLRSSATLAKHHPSISRWSDAGNARCSYRAFWKPVAGGSRRSRPPGSDGTARREGWM